MNDDISTSPEDLLDDLAMRHAFGTLSDAERVQFETCMCCPLSRAATVAAEYRDVVAAMTTATLPACPPPPPEVKARILDAIQLGDRPPLPARAPSIPPQAISFIGKDDIPWSPMPHRGVRFRELSSSSPDYSIVMISLEPGALYPHHAHQGAEDIYLLSGDASMDGKVMHAGDFLHWEPGTEHHDMTSAGGCQVMVITSRKNYSPPLVRAYTIARRMATKVGRALGVKVEE